MIFFYFLEELEEALFNVFVVYSQENKKKVKNFMLFKVEVIREMQENARKIPADALHKICENTGDYGSVKIRILVYFM